MKNCLLVIKNKKYHFLLLLVLITAFLARIIGLNWDQNQHLHPDERFLTMVSADLKLPKTIFQYFDPKTSPLNPENSGYDFYVYGTFPLLITRTIAEILKLTSYDQIFLVGRFLSAVFDSLTVLLIFLISLKIFKKPNIALLGAFLYSICLLPIQQSHYFTVDSPTVFFFTLTILLMIYGKPLFSGLMLGFTLANKTSVGITLPVLLLYIFSKNQSFLGNRQNFIKNLVVTFSKCCLFLVFAFIAFRIFQPYAFNGLVKISPNFISNINEAHQLITGFIDYPPNVQWKSTLPIIHPLLNLFFVGLGPVTFILLIIGLVSVFKNHQLIKHPQVLMLLFICLVIFFYHSFQLAKYLRYFYPIYPIFAVFAGYGLSRLTRKLIISVLLINLIITTAFLNIYLQVHSRYQSSNWICQNVATTSILSSESWDDSLPINSSFCLDKVYWHQELPLFDVDSPSKWVKIEDQLKSVDYLILSSNRGWGSISKNPKDYQLSADFYNHLFEGTTDFKLVKRIYSYPGFSLPFIKKCVLIGPSVYPYRLSNNTFFEIDKFCDFPGIYFRDDAAEESFTVYDHPQVNIFAKVK